MVSLRSFAHFFRGEKSSQKKEEETTVGSSGSKDIMISGWAYNSGIVEAITQKMGIPSQHDLRNFLDNREGIRRSIDGNPLSQFSVPFESYHDNLIRLEKSMIDLAKELSITTERADILGPALNSGNIESALKTQVSVCKQAADMPCEREAIEETRLAVLLCAQMYRSTRLGMYEVLNEYAADEIMTLAVSESSVFSASQMSVEGEVRTRYADKPLPELTSIHDIPMLHGSEAFRMFERLGLSAYYKIDYNRENRKGKVTVTAFPDMLPEGINVLNHNHKATFGQESGDFARTNVMQSYQARLACKENVSHEVDDQNLNGY